VAGAKPEVANWLTITLSVVVWRLNYNVLISESNRTIVIFVKKSYWLVRGFLLRWTLVEVRIKSEDHQDCLPPLPVTNNSTATRFDCRTCASSLVFPCSTSTWPDLSVNDLLPCVVISSVDAGVPPALYRFDTLYSRRDWEGTFRCYCVTETADCFLFFSHPFTLAEVRLGSAPRSIDSYHWLNSPLVKSCFVTEAYFSVLLCDK
jgi:hypothetical protein